GFQTIRTMLAQPAQQSDEMTSRLIETARGGLRQARRRWEHQHSFLLHLDLRGKQERDFLRWNRQRTALDHQVRLMLMQRRARLESLTAQLVPLSPRRILERGYAIVFDS